MGRRTRRWTKTPILICFDYGIFPWIIFCLVIGSSVRTVSPFTSFSIRVTSSTPTMCLIRMSIALDFFCFLEIDDFDRLTRTFGILSSICLIISCCKIILMHYFQLSKDDFIRALNLSHWNNLDITIANCLHLLLTEEGVDDWIHPSRTSRFVLTKYFLHLTCRSGPKLLVKHAPGFFVYPHPAT